MKIGKVIKDISIMLTTKVISLGIVFISTMFLSRYLSVRIFGAFSFSKSIGSLILTFTFMGVPTIMVRDLIGKRIEDISSYYNIVNSFRKLLDILSILLVIVYVFFNNSYIYDEKIILMSITISYIVSHSSLGLAESIFQILGEYRIIAKTNLTIAIIELGLNIFAYVINVNIIIFAIINIISNFIYAVIVNKILENVGIKLKLNISYENFLFFVKKAKESLNIFISTIFALINNYFDTIFLNIMKGNISVSYYSAGYKLFPVFNIIPTMIMKVMFPNIANSSLEDSKIKLKTVLRFLNYVYIIILNFILINSNLIVMMIFGSEYIVASKVLVILTIGLIGTFIIYPVLSFFNAKDMDRYSKYITLSMAVVNVILNMLLIPKYDYIGASIATTFSNFLAYVITMIICIKKKIVNINFIIFMISLYVFNSLGIMLIFKINSLFARNIISLIATIILLILYEYKIILKYIGRRRK